ncbi:MAG: sulfatase-like hydrolase/transferase, partial [Thermoplasmata archaeon]
LGRDGILFTKAISPSPWTLPSVASIMTGLSPSVHMTIGRESKLQDSFRTLAEYMLDAGYFTAAIGSNDFLTSRRNIAQGFIEYNFFPKPSIGKSFGARLLKRVVPSRFRAKVSTHDLTKLACHWIEENYERDFFLWIHYFDPHLPYAPPLDFIKKSAPPQAIGTNFSKLDEVRGGYFVPSLAERDWIRELYGSEVRYVDNSLGSLLDTLKRLNLYEESLIIFTSDHGEEFWEHGGFEHGHTLYNEVLWVPLMIKPPLSVSKKLAKKVVSQVITTTSITPTILDICRIGYEKGFLSAAPLSPLWEMNSDGFKPGPIISTGQLYYEDQESVIFDGLKYIRSLVTNHEELYDLASDPKEKNCIASLFPNKTQRIGYILREHKETAKKLRKHYGIFKKETIEVDKETIERLKSLGYVQ